MRLRKKEWEEGRERRMKLNKGGERTKRKGVNVETRQGMIEYLYNTTFKL